jgi:hypothetical protein
MKRHHSKWTRKNKTNSESAIVKKVIRLEKLVWKTAQERDADRFQQLVPANAIMIFQSGVVPQPEYLATMNERTISRYELRRFRGFMPNSQTVILYYEALRLGEEAGKTFPEGAVIESTTWIKRSARWVAILNQETPVANS